jgi:(1->4)-alpha-D-glucan 1-alpha-D-glucosylmutase
MVESALNQLARLWGIELEYRDVWGKSHSTSDETKISFLRAMGLPVDVGSDMQTLLTEHETSSRGQVVGPVQVVRETVSPIRTLLRVPKEHMKKHFEWTLIEEHGKHHSGIFVPERLQTNESGEHEQFVQCVFKVPATPGCGYHWIEIRECDEKGKPKTLLGKMQLIVTPEICYMPRGLREDGRVWGPAIQLYALKSGRNWGIGDFTDLKAIIGYCADAGAGIVGLNPLHSLFPLKPEHRSPYAPSSRTFLNFLYLDVEAVAGFEECDEAKETVQSPEFQARLAALRDQELVDYPEVVTLKRSILEMLYEDFRKRHLGTESERGRAFRTFQAMGGKELHGYGVFEALQEHCHSSLSLWGWPTWPQQYQKSQSQAVVEFASAYQERVEFFQYLQWQADLQLGSAGHLAMERGLKVGLYEDLAVSVDPAGFETWFYQNIYALDASIGAPPDDFNLNGQDWGLPPPIPRRLVEASYAPFVAALRFNMRHAGAIRIDHVMELMRLFWVPSGQSPSDGAYVRYPFHDLMGILALESQRNRCLVIGEDLGTVPEEIREALRAMGVLSFRLLYFEKDTDGNFRKPADYPDQAVVAVGTHDLPTLPGYWQGQDLIVRGELELFPTEELREAHTVGRSEDRVRLLFALKKEDLLPEGIEIDVGSLPKMSPDLVTAVYRYLARSPAKILLFQLEDVLGQLDQINLPGTATEYPNWQRKLTTLLESFSEDARLESLATALQLERGVGTVAPTYTPSREKTIPIVPRIPVATYRLQLNADFNFSRAAETTAYLKELGISHCYISPYLKARPGSAHGYDIVDHGTLNPELGTIEEFEHLVHSLGQHGMGQILDFVPNHMAAGCDNPWWVDILENGQASEYAEFFDIAWHPLKDDLRGKVLIPILEDHYGAVLEKGLLCLAFDTEIGEFSLWYHEHRLPVDPASYTIILSHGIARLETRLEATGPQFLPLRICLNIGRLRNRKLWHVAVTKRF